MRATTKSANTVDASPPTRVSVVNGPTRSGPYHRVMTANAGGNSTAEWRNPARTHTVKNTEKVGNNATSNNATPPTPEPAGMTVRGRLASRMRPTRIPATAETMRPAERAAVIAVGLHPVSWEIGVTATGSE